MSSVAEWLAGLGLSDYADACAENDVDISVLHLLTDQDLKELGVSLGHPRKMLAAIAELEGAARATSQSAAPPEPKRQDEAERRQLSVMFCDLVGSTSLSTRLDPEDLRAVIGAYHRCCTELIEEKGGFVAKYIGDGVLAYFGYPHAHEHDAERAVQAGLALVEAVPKLDTAASVALQVRIGIATGLVVVGDLIGKGAAQEQAVVGETPNLAARLQALAEPSAVVISSTTQRLTAGPLRVSRSRHCCAQGFRRESASVAGSGRRRRGKPLRGAARSWHASRRARRGGRASHAPLGSGESRRRTEQNRSKQRNEAEPERHSDGNHRDPQWIKNL
jgi:class 3 adenylate cyclase